MRVSGFSLDLQASPGVRRHRGILRGHDSSSGCDSSTSASWAISGPAVAPGDLLPSATITDTSNIMNGIVSVQLDGPDGTNGPLRLDLRGDTAGNSQLFSDPALAAAPSPQDLQLDFSSTLPGLYSTAGGEWDATVPTTPPSGPQEVDIPDYTLPSPWAYFRKVRFTQYNTPYENAGCTGGPADAYLVSAVPVTGGYKCSFEKVKLNSEFISQTWTNGTGVSNNYGILKNAWAVGLGDGNPKQQCGGQYPPGAVGHTRYGGNTFKQVPSITGSCPTYVLGDGAAAMPVDSSYAPTTLSGVVALTCGYRLNLDAGDYTTAYTRTIEDKCPMCSDESTYAPRPWNAQGHVDSYTTNQACKRRAFGDLGVFYASNVTQ